MKYNTILKIVSRQKMEIVWKVFSGGATQCGKGHGDINDIIDRD